MLNFRFFWNYASLKWFFFIIFHSFVYVFDHIHLNIIAYLLVFYGIYVILWPMNGSPCVFTQACTPYINSHYITRKQLSVKVGLPRAYMPGKTCCGFPFILGERTLDFAHRVFVANRPEIHSLRQFKILHMLYYLLFAILDHSESPNENNITLFLKFQNQLHMPINNTFQNKINSYKAMIYC